MFPHRAVLALGGAVGLLLLVVAGRYGWHRDELYFLEAGKHLAWGYVDQPPFTPLVARLADEIAPGNLVLLRTLPAIATAATVAFGAGIVRELGGSTRAQVVGAAAVGAGGFALGVGHLLSTATFDLLVWMALLWVATRLLRTADPRLWLAFGAISGASMLNKNLLVLLGFALLSGLVIERRWDLLGSPWLVGGAVLALVIASPNLLWQAHHGWPQADMARALSRRLAGENRATLLPAQLLFSGPALIGVLGAGARWLARAAAARPYRPLLWAWPAALVATFATGGRPYYVLPITLAVVLAGVASDDGTARLRRVAGLVVLNALISVPFSLPVLPRSTVGGIASLNEAVAETVGWPQLTAQVADVVDDLPSDERRSVVLLGATFAEAAAIDRFGPAHDLPPAYSPHNGYADFRRPTDELATVVAVAFQPADLRPYFHQCAEVDTIDNRLGIDNDTQGMPIVVCRGLRNRWPTTWEELRFLA